MATTTTTTATTTTFITTTAITTVVPSNGSPASKSHYINSIIGVILSCVIFVIFIMIAVLIKYCNAPNDHKKDYELGPVEYNFETKINFGD